MASCDWIGETGQVYGLLLHYPTGNGCQRFGGKTQGYPSHLAVLVVAILLESRFPLQKIIQAHADVFAVADRDLLLTMLTRATHEQQINLRANAWQRPDQEQDVTILRILLALTLISRQEATFWHLRIYILEHSELWIYLVAPTETESVA